MGMKGAIEVKRSAQTTRPQERPCTDRDCGDFSVVALHRQGAFDLKPHGSEAGRNLWYRDVDNHGAIDWTVTADERGDPAHCRLSYEVEGQLEEQTIKFTSTPCYFGGAPRWWFVCPAEDCGRRVGKLYLAPGRTDFECRHCVGFVYATTREPRHIRLRRRLSNVRRRLGWRDGLDSRRPKGMHESTFAQLVIEESIFNSAHAAALLDRYSQAQEHSLLADLTLID